MAKGTAAAIIRVIRSAADAGGGGPSDRDLLRQFGERNDQAAFAVVVRRHGNLVLGVCRRALPTVQDAEDACQATFLILAQKAKRNRWQPSVANWLYATARKVCRNARVAAERRARREARAAVPAAVSPADQMTGRELLAALDEEMDRLPPRYREPLVLCYLEGLTRDEAAARLELPAATLKTQLERGRKRVSDALTRRGFALGAGLLALAATSPAGASPPRLVQAILAAASGSAPVAVAALAKGVAMNGIVSKSVLALAAVLGGLALGVGSVSFQSVAAEAPPTVVVKEPTEAAPPQPSEAPAQATYAGRVLGPDGTPVADAKLYLLYYTPKVLPIPQRATSAKDGSFRFSVDRAEFDRTIAARPWDEAIVAALADGYGLGFPQFQIGQMPDFARLTVQLVKDDAPITGRILDLQGRPIAGVSAVVHDLWWPMANNDLTAWVAYMKGNKEDWYSMLRKFGMLQAGLYMGRDLGRILPPAVSDAEGRVTIRGIGPERIVAFRLEGTTIDTTSLWAMTRPGDTMRIPMDRRGGANSEITFFGSSFEQIVQPGRPIVGVVRDKDTGRPIPGAIVQPYMVGLQPVNVMLPGTVTDKDGRYRLLGVRKGSGDQLRVSPPDGQPYLSALARVPDGPGLEAVTVDVALKRGVWITGKVTDKVTEEGVHSWINYAVFADNPNRAEAPGLVIDFNMQSRPDGTFRFVGLPGRGVVAARDVRQRNYRTFVGADRIKDFNRLFLNGEPHTVAEVNPEKRAEAVTCDLVLHPGRAVTGTIVGPDGEPVPGVLIRGLQTDAWDDRPAGAEFSAQAPNAGEERLMQFLHPRQKLAGSVVIRGDQNGPLTVRLEPAAALTGRFVTTDGKPLADLDIHAVTMDPLPKPVMRMKPDVTAGSFPRGPRTDKDGKFRIEGLAPSLKYRLAVLRGMFMLSPEGDLGVTLKSGETKDLGELKVRLPEQ